jgi:hypothetical protein
MECKQEGQMPIITPKSVTKEEYHEIMKIIHKKDKKYAFGHYVGTFDIRPETWKH